MSTHSMQVLTCNEYGCPGCGYRHFYRTSDDSRLTEVPGDGLYSREELGLLGRVPLATGAITPDR